MRRPRLLFLSQFANPGSWNPQIWRRVLGHDDEAAAFEALLDSLGVLDGLDFAGCHAHMGAPLPDDLGAIDAVVLGGSFASVADAYPWQQALQAWLLRWRATGKPLMGICGGHQLMTVTLGGRVERSPAGPEVGSLPVTRTPAGRSHALFAGFGDEAPFFFGNSDRVVEPSPGATVLATRPNLPAAALDHGGNWVSVQFHPETTCDRMATCWAEIDAARGAAYHFIPGCERMILNYLRLAGVVGTVAA